MKVHVETHRQEPDFVWVDKKGNEKRHPQYSVEVTIMGDRRRVACGEVWNDRLAVFNLAVRFSDGAKVWRGQADYLVNTGVVNNLQPCIDKRGHFHLVGYFEDYAQKAVASQHNAM